MQDIMKGGCSSQVENHQSRGGLEAEAEAEGSQGQGLPGLESKFKASVGYITQSVGISEYLES